MANAVELWETVLAQLQHLSTQHTAAGSDDPPGTSYSLPALEDIEKLPRANHTVWDNLLNELKVPLHLGRAVASAPDPFTPTAYAAVSALDALFWRAHADRILVGEALTGNPTSSLGMTIGQQLQQSGFMAALPRLLDAAAAALNDTQHKPALALVPQHSGYTLSAASAQIAGVASSVHYMQGVIVQLLQLMWPFTDLWPQFMDTAAVSVATSRTCIAAIQHCSRCVDLMSPDAPAPTALEDLMEAASRAVQGVCAAMATVKGAAFAAGFSYPEALQATSMQLLLLALVPQHSTDDATGATSSSNASSEVSSSNAGIISTSHAAWRYACTHQSDLSELQQQALQALGCSSRAFLFAARRAGAASFEPVQVYNAFLYLAQGSRCPLLPDLQQPEQLQQLAVALTQPTDPDKGGMPPCGSRFAPCAGLLWLVPAVLLERATQLANGLDACSHPVHMQSTLLWMGLKQLTEQWDFWGKAVTRLHNAFLQQMQQGILFLDAARMYGAAVKAAGVFSCCWEPPPAHLVQMLHLASGAAAYTMARMQEALRASTPTSSSAAAAGSSSTAGAGSNIAAAGSSSSSGSASGGLTCDASSDGAGTAGSRGVSGIDRSCGGVGGTQQDLGKSLFELYLGLIYQVHMLSHSIWLFADRKDMASVGLPIHIPSNSMHDGALGNASQDSWVPGSQDSEQQATACLTSMCAAWQQALPQLTSLAEAAVRFEAVNLTLRDSEPHRVMHSASSSVKQLCDQGLFLAGNLQLGSPALKPLSGLAFTVLKLASATLLTKPQPGQQAVEDQEAAKEAVECVRAVLSLNSLVLQAACASTKESSTCDAGTSADHLQRSSADAVVSMLVNSKAAAGTCGTQRLSAVSESTASSTASSNSNGTDAVELVSWLVSLGRCCMGYALVLQQSQAGGAAWIAGWEGSQHCLGVMAQALQEVAAVLPAWLQSSSVSAQLAAAGYSTQRVLELLQSTVQAGQDAPHAGAAAAVSPELLQELGLALSNMPVGTACNNHRCSSLAGLSEQQLVVGTARLCGGCRVARYCCRACQAAAWKQHKPACKAVAGARAAQPAA